MGLHYSPVAIACRRVDKTGKRQSCPAEPLADDQSRHAINPSQSIALGNRTTAEHAKRQLPLGATFDSMTLADQTALWIDRIEFLFDCASRKAQSPMRHSACAPPHTL